MPPVFPSGQIPPGACVQVRPVGATLPTAARRAPSREAADGYTCPPAPDGSPTGKHVTPGPQSPVTGTGRSNDRWRGQVQNFDLNGRSDAGHILQPQKTRMSWTAFPRTPANTKKESPDDFSSEDSFKARRLPTLPPGLAVPSAMTGLASLFGMGRGGSPSL